LLFVTNFHLIIFTNHHPPIFTMFQSVYNRYWHQNHRF